MRGKIFDPVVVEHARATIPVGFIPRLRDY
jgi:hypothetical protein